jgi:hypothetical protein
MRENIDAENRMQRKDYEKKMDEVYEITSRVLNPDFSKEQAKK